MLHKNPTEQNHHIDFYKLIPNAFIILVKLAIYSQPGLKAQIKKIVYKINAFRSAMSIQSLRSLNAKVLRPLNFPGTSLNANS